MILPIITYPNPVLKKKTRKLKEKEIKSPEIKGLILDMLETVEQTENCLGLAAPQVGVSVRLSVFKLQGKTYIIINPKIKKRSWKKVIVEEGCLSFPGKFISVKRSKTVKVEALNRLGKKIIIAGDGLLAQVLQHEIDHLDGILFIKREIHPVK